jgi:chromatin modification-related protein VID21
MAALPQVHLQAMQAQVQAQQHRLPVATPQADISNLVLQARRIQDQQRAAVQQLQQQQQHQHAQQLQQHHQPQQVVQQMQQHQQAIQQPQPMSQLNGTQGSPPMRNVVNGLNGTAFISNAQAMVASFNAANSGGLAGSPGAGLTMPSMVAGSPRGHTIPPQQMPVVAQRLRELEQFYRTKNPTLPADTVRQLATEHLSKLIVQTQQNAMTAAAGGMVPQPMNGMTQTSSPHQYAQLLRAQQAQQAAAQAQQASQHQRQASGGSATPVPGK